MFWQTWPIDWAGSVGPLSGQGLREETGLLSPGTGKVISWIWVVLDTHPSSCFVFALTLKKHHTVVISEPFKIVWKEAVNQLNRHLTWGFSVSVHFLQSFTRWCSKSIHCLYCPALLQEEGGTHRAIPLWLADLRPFSWLQEWQALSLSDERSGLHIVKLLFCRPHLSIFWGWFWQEASLCDWQEALPGSSLVNWLVL